MLVVSPLELIRKQQVQRLNASGVKAALLEDLSTLTCEDLDQGGWQRGLEPSFYDCPSEEIWPSETKYWFRGKRTWRTSVGGSFVNVLGIPRSNI